MQKPNVAVFIDADNVSAASVRDIFKTVCHIGEPIVRRAYGTPRCFQGEAGWHLAQREYGISSRPQVSNLSGKNAADIALVIDAMECLYRFPCEAIFIVSNDSDYTALAKKIRESGKAVYGVGGVKAPMSFKSAVAEESLQEIVATALRHEQPGCVCPDCGTQMSLVRVSSGKKATEIDVCPKCRTVWYDKDEFESLAPNDKLLVASVSAGKSFRREVTAQLAADLREQRLKPKNIGALKGLIKNVYHHAPNPDILAIVASLCSQKVVTIAKTGELSLCPIQN